MDGNEKTTRVIVGGVDTHKDLHVAAIVDEQDHVLGTQSFPATRQGYRQMLVWMRAAGNLLRVGVESTGSYGARGCCAICKLPGSRCWRSQRLIGMTVAGVARVTIWMLRALPMLLLLVSGLLPRAVETAWWNLSEFCGHVGKQL